MHVITNKYFKIIVILFFAIITLVACVETTTPRTNASTTTTTLTFQTKALAEGVVGSSYTDNLANATGSDSITYELKSGSSLPEGLSLSSSGLLSGIPLSSVLEYSFTVIASAENTVSAEATFIITIKASLTYSSFTLPEANVNAFYSANLGTATGAEDINYSLQEGSTLPSGLTLSENGILSGSPTETVTNHSFVVLVQSENAVETTATFSINVNPEDTTIIPDTIVYEGITLTTGEVEVAYNADIALATGSDDIVYTLKSGSVLPTGLSLSSVGILTGTPTEPVTDFSFIVVDRKSVV